MFNRETMTPNASDTWRWDGSERVARLMWTHARDEAGILYFQPPNRFEDVRGAGYVPARLRLQLNGGQGEEWQIIPIGALVRKTGTPAEPQFSITAPRAEAAVFDA